ncbi:MAG: DNA primase, partial [Clostridia bacterium]|nr:DNA primase [Clostridia bacterium]
MRITEEFKNDVIAANDIVDVVSHYVQLKRSGSNMSGLCPFHREKTPSFSVSPSLQIFKCFGCGVGGNVIDFIMRIENL